MCAVADLRRTGWALSSDVRAPGLSDGLARSAPEPSAALRLVWNRPWCQVRKTELQCESFGLAIIKVDPDRWHVLVVPDSTDRPRAE